MNTKLILSLLCGSAIVLTGCSKKLNQFSADYFSTNPSPLEVVGENVPATVTANIPSKFFVKNAEVTVTPYLVYAGKETASAPYTVQGEKVRGNNQVIPFESGSTVTIPVMYKYEPEMMHSDLYLGFDVKQGKKAYVLPRVKVADGVIATATLSDAGTVKPAIAADKYQRIINEKYNADIKFLINQTNIRAGELSSEAIKGLHNELKAANAADNKEVEGISISSYASPEGGVKVNTRVAEGREKSTQAYLNKQLKSDKISKFGELTADFTAQDWEGFKSLVSASNIQDKDLILSVLEMYKDPEQREKEIRNLSSVFDQLAKEILPQLRYSRLTASINVIGKSDEAIMAAFESNPKELNVDEMLYCATLTKDNNKKLKIYETAVNQFPDDHRAYNNLGMCQYINKDIKSASRNFAKAGSMAPASSEAKMNLGLVSLANNDYRTAHEKFGSAVGVNELPEALGVLYMKTGDYSAAAKSFGDSKTNNAALSQILVKDYSAAKKTLSSIENPDATTHYLNAILGARTNNEQVVTSNLRKAASLDGNMVKKAKSDLEFAKFDISKIF
ncbi:MAG: hypothetical protein RSC87_05425 [Muribaculaceae bacterium]